MTSASPTNQPHLISLVLQSKKALQHGELLCTRAQAASHASAQAAVDVLALDAKVRWVVDAVVEQLQLAANVAKLIEEKRAHIGKQVREWETSRMKRSDSLDATLESLGAQVVPPEFYQTSDDSSLFGSQPSSDVEAEFHENVQAGNSSSPKNFKIANGSANDKGCNKISKSPESPSATLRRNNSLGRNADNKNGIQTPNGKGKVGRGEGGSKAKKLMKVDRRRWKVLRDFVDDQAVDNLLEVIENDRLVLEGIISQTNEYPEQLTSAINNIMASLPRSEPNDPGALALTQRIISAQESLGPTMATLLENLVGHYDNMANALKDTENGEIFSEEDLQIMNRDTEELTAIMAEMDESTQHVEGYHAQLLTAKDDLEKDIEHLNVVVTELDELDDIMSQMIQTQESVEIQADEEIDRLHLHLTTLEQLQEQFVAYRMAFNKLLLEMARRQRYKESVESLVRGMMKQLDSMTEDESRIRDHFNKEYGSNLPEDLCLCIGNSPNRWEVVPYGSSVLEVLPWIDNDIIFEAKERAGNNEGSGPTGAESL